MFKPNTIAQGDCVKILNECDEPFADLIFADPPFNIGYNYDKYDDRQKHDYYVNWTRQWMSACKQVLKPDGSFWIAIGDEYAAEIRIIARELGLNLRNWIIWHYTFGQNARGKFSRAHAHIFYFTNDEKNFVFNDRAVRTFSDRERVYRDKRAKPEGRLPDDVWTEFPRVCGTFAERQGWHPCQMPESILERIIRVSSNPGQLVFDPFSGSGTTLAAAKKLSRNYFGTELSENYVSGITERLANITPLADDIQESADWASPQIELLKNSYREFAVPMQTLEKSSEMLERFAQRFSWRLDHSGLGNLEICPDELLTQLKKLQSTAQLPKIRVHVKE